MESFDLIIVGAGPAALTASIYASRYRLSNLVVGKQLGGELALAHKIENYPGFESIPGPELVQKFGQQVEKLGAKLLYEDVGKIERTGSDFIVETAGGEKYQSKAVVVATGSERRRLGVPGEKELTGRGVSYCTTCDAPFYRGKKVGVIGGSDAAVSGAVHAAEFADKIYLIYRGEQLRAEPIWLEELKAMIDSGKVTVIYKTNVKEILGKQEIEKLRNSDANSLDIKGDTVGGVKLDQPYQNSDILELDGIFVEIGGIPGTSLVKGLGVEVNETDHVRSNEDMSTNIPGLFCAGDMVDRSRFMQQAITAMAQGAIAAGSAYKFLKGTQAPRILGI